MTTRTPSPRPASPPAYFSQVEGPIADRTALVDSPYTNYLVPNQQKLKDPKVRQALALATRQGVVDPGRWWRQAAFKPAYSIVNPSGPGIRRGDPSFADIPDEGDAAAAKAQLDEAGGKRRTRSSSPTGGPHLGQGGRLALKETWDKAGFKIALDPLEDTYYDVIQKPDADFDVIWAGWGADWASIRTVIPPLFDSRIEHPGQPARHQPATTTATTGATRSTRSIDKAAATRRTSTARTACWPQADTKLGEDVAYIPLEITSSSTSCTDRRSPATRQHRRRRLRRPRPHRRHK